MLDIWMVLTLTVALALIVGFVVWCGKTVEDTGGRTRMTIVLIFTCGLLVYLIYALLHPEKF